jgi:hypothetical protein
MLRLPAVFPRPAGNRPYRRVLSRQLRWPGTAQGGWRLKITLQVGPTCK